MAELTTTPKDKTAAEKVSSRRKVDYVAENLSEYPKYVAKWIKAPWFPSMRQDPSFYSFLNHKTLPKEFAEAYAAYKEVKSCIKMRCKAHTDTSKVQPLQDFLEASRTPVTSEIVPPRDVLLIDMCCGKGFLSVLLNYKFPNAHILMIDNMGKMNLEHLENLPRIDFWMTDITRPRFIDDLRLRSKDFKAVIFIGIHLCGDLSEIFLSAFHSLPNATCMVLSPCCISKQKTELLERAKREGLDNYELWSQELFKMIQPASKELKKLDECGSQKNNFLLACT